MVLLFAKQIITLYHAVQKSLTKDQHALEGGPLKSDQKELDKLYEKYKGDDTDWSNLIEEFNSITAFMKELNVNYKERKVNGVSHLYALWGVSKFNLYV